MHSKKATDKTKRQPAEWENIFANDVTDRALVSKIHKVTQFNIINTRNQTKYRVENLNRHFSKEAIKMARGT